MGSAVSATGADKRAMKKQTKRQEQREKRRIQRFKKQLVHKYGDNLKYDENGVLFYVDDNDEKIYIDKQGNAYHLDDSDQPYYLDERGVRFYLDENREPYYLEDDGTKYFLDTVGRKYYFDENGEPYLVYTGDDNDEDDENTKFLNGVEENTMTELNESELKLRSPATETDTDFKMKPRVKENTRETYSLSSRRNYTRSTSRSPTSTIGGVRRKSESKSSREGIDIHDRDSASFMPEETSMFDSTLSSYSTLSFMRSEYEMDISNTPDYIKDTSEESETRIDAQIEAENKILKKLLKQEKEKIQLPTGKSCCKVGDFNIKIESDKKDCTIVDTTFLSTGNFIIADSGNCKVKQFDENLDYINSLDIDEHPYSFCSWNDDIVHVTFQSRLHNGIKVLKVTTSEITDTRTIHLTSGAPYGIARSNRGLAVLMSTEEGWQVHLMTLKGQCSRLLKFDNDEMTTPLMSPHYLIVTKTMKIIISDRGSNCVYSFDTNGKILMEYKQIREPLGICSDNKGSLFIVSPGVVHQISETGERIKALLRRETIRFAPVCISYDPEDCLLILAGRSNTIAAFELT